MDRRERIGDPEESFRIAIDAHQGKIWTALPGIVQSFDPAKMTVSVQPTINGSMQNPDGTLSDLQMPVLLDCPVLWQGGGGVSLTFPIAAGDECLVVFASRCIDAWWQLGGVRGQAEFRMHDLSDGFALVGVRSLPRAYTVGSTAKLRTDDGAAFVEVDPASHTINITSTAPVNVTSSQSANVTAPAINLGASGQSLLAFVTSAFQALFNGHTHTSNASGSPTSAPNQTMTSSHLTSTVKGG